MSELNQVDEYNEYDNCWDAEVWMLKAPEGAEHPVVEIIFEVPLRGDVMATITWVHQDNHSVARPFYDIEEARNVWRAFRSIGFTKFE